MAQRTDPLQRLRHIRIPILIVISCCRAFHMALLRTSWNKTHACCVKLLRHWRLPDFWPTSVYLGQRNVLSLTLRNQPTFSVLIVSFFHIKCIMRHHLDMDIYQVANTAVNYLKNLVIDTYHCYKCQVNSIMNLSYVRWWRFVFFVISGVCMLALNTNNDLIFTICRLCYGLVHYGQQAITWTNDDISIEISICFSQDADYYGISYSV